jgi:2-desacetyl-2-hydroxyethyl bacteriochlorophyllide A dehydrogenase
MDMSKTMQAVVFQGEGRWRLEDVEMPEITTSDEVLLKVERASICGTDVHILAVPPGHPATPGSILGHEYVATVVGTGSRVRHLAPGDRVVIDPNITCGFCDYCRMGMTNLCENMTSLGIFRHGGLAEFNVAPATALHRISPSIPLERAMLAEPLACILPAFEKAQFVPGESVAILGAGPIGLMFLMLFKAAGASIVCVIEPGDFRRQKALEFGADLALNPTSDDVVKAVVSLTRRGADIVIDAVGTLLPEAIAVVRRGGRVILFGMNQQAERPVNQYGLTRYEISVLGSYIQRTAFPKVVRILEAGLVPVEKLVTHRLRLSDFGIGLQAMRTGEALKVSVEP